MTAIDDLIQWGPELTTGIAQIDEQHKVLVDMCNEANTLLRGHVDPEDARRLVRDLMSYAMYHFEAEEELAIDGGYNTACAAENALHREQHRSFASTVAELQQSLATGKVVSRETLLGFLNAWLINHIQGTDMLLAAFLKNAGYAGPVDSSLK